MDRPVLRPINMAARRRSGNRLPAPRHATIRPPVACGNCAPAAGIGPCAGGRSVTFALVLCVACGGLAARTPAQDGDRVPRLSIDRTSKCAIGRPRACSIKVAVAHGLFPTGLRPRFAAGVTCRGIDEGYAIDYTYKRDRESYHGGIDMPAPFGTPIVAAAAGTVVGVYDGADSYRGKEIILRHTPEDTGIPLYIYTTYGHFERTPAFRVGDRVRMGEVLGATGNSGVTPGRRGRGRGGGKGGGLAGARRRDGHGNRRPAIHFAVFYSAKPQYAVLDQIVIPADAFWMDPLALYRGAPPYDSAAMKALPAGDKSVPIPYMLSAGSTHPAGTRLIWPYACRRR
jgi:hypothetical protein